MKTFKLLFAAIIFVGFTTSAMAQQSDNATINANAEVLAPISVFGAENLLFDIVSPGIPKTVDLDGSATGGTVTDAEQAARFDISAGNNANVSLSYTTIPTELDGPDNATMPITFSSAWGTASIYDESGFETVNVTESENTDATTSNEGEISVFLGGTVTPDNNQSQGTYTADVTLTVEYN